MSESGTEQITVKVYRRTHAKLKRAQAEIAGRRRVVAPLVRVLDEVVDAGLKKLKLGR